VGLDHSRGWKEYLGEIFSYNEGFLKLQEITIVSTAGRLAVWPDTKPNTLILTLSFASSFSVIGQPEGETGNPY